jgi:alkylation response protein AidB-like acyl-CoA dehydrogenase
MLAAADLPAELMDRCSRLQAFLHDEVAAREERDRVRLPGDATPELRRWVRSRSEALGFYRLLQPAELGGEDLGPLAQAALHEAIGASGAVLGALALGDSGGLLRLARGTQRDRWLLPVLRGEMEAAFAFTDAREGPQTTAARHGNAFVLDGVKSFVTGGPHADLLLTVANVTENAGGPTGTAIFVVRRDAPGVTLRRELRTLDGDVHGEFVLTDVRLSVDDVLGDIGQGLPRAREKITALRLRAAGLACGTGRWTLDYTLRQVSRPHRSGQPLAEREQVQAMIAESATELFAARAALYGAARLAERAATDTERAADRPDADVEVAMAKVVATETVARIVDRAIQITGGAAVVEDHPLAALYRRVRGWRIGEGTTEVLRLVIARGILQRTRGGAEWSR